MEEHGWRLSAKCASLTAQRADELFFPTSGGKPHKAKQFCNDCPFKRRCLIDAIEKSLVGYFAGTTDEDRRHMRKLHGIKVTGLDMPPEPDRTTRKILLKVFTPDDPRDWLDDIRLEPSVEELVDSEDLDPVLV